MQRLRRLARRRSSRRSEGCFLVDGPLLVAEALEAGTGLEAVYAEPAADPELLERARAADVEVLHVADGALRKVLDLVNPQPLVAVARQPAVGLSEVLGAAKADGRAVLVLVGIQDPGNAGTLLRVAEASGCAGVLLTEGSVDAWNPKVVRASAGSLLRVPVVEGLASDGLPAAFDDAGVALVATVASGGSAPESAPLDGALGLLVGSEAQGLPGHLAVRARVRVTIPMEGGVESLNAAVAGALVAFEAARQRRRRTGDEVGG